MPKLQSMLHWQAVSRRRLRARYPKQALYVEIERKNRTVREIMTKIYTLALLFFPGILWGQQRFPNPEFKSGYRLPAIERPVLQFSSDPNVAFIALLIVMGLTAYCVYYRRSRRPLRWLLVASILYFGFYHKGCVCPVGSIQNVFEALFDTRKTLPFFVIGAFLGPLIAAVFFGRVFCFSACPLGAIQELVIFRPFKVPAPVDRCLQVVPFIYLGLAVLFAAGGLGYIICDYDPFVGLYRFSAALPLLMCGAGLLLLGTVVARPYCRYICPYSALLRIVSKLSSRKVLTTSDSCNNCHLCSNSCPVNAIEPPAPKTYPESKREATKRIQWIFAVSPLVLTLGIFLGSLLGSPLSNLHPDIELLRKLEISMVEDNQAVAFLMKGGKIEELQPKAIKAQRNLNIGGVVFGAYMAIVFLGFFITIHQRRSNEQYAVKVSACVTCAQCYRYCPDALSLENNGKSKPIS